MPKIYGFNNGGREGWMHACAIAEDGKVLASHVCSNESFMPHDLGMNGQSDWKHDRYQEHYPEGFECEFVPSYKIESHKGLQAAFAANRERAENPQAINY